MKRQVFEFYQKNANALEGLKAPIYEDKVVDFILERSNISIRQVNIEELTQAAEQEAPVKAKSASGGRKSSSESGEKKKESKKSGKK